MSELHVYKCQQCGDKITTVMPDPTCCGGPIVEICPLPRIGSKDWEWEYSFYSTGWFTSPMTKYQVSLVDQKWCVVCLGLSGELRFLASGDSSIVTKRIAELLARRDWRRENRGKKS